MAGGAAGQGHPAVCMHGEDLSLYTRSGHNHHCIVDGTAAEALAHYSPLATAWVPRLCKHASVQACVCTADDHKLRRCRTRVSAQTLARGPAFCVTL